MLKNLRILLFLILFQNKAIAQIKNTEQLKDIIEKYIENNESTLDFLDLYDQIDFYVQNPININKASQNDLLKMPLITPQKANAVLQHIKQYGPLKHIVELQLIEGFDASFIEIFKNFVKLKSTNFNYKQAEFWKTDNEIILFSSRKLELAKGYTINDSNKNKFQGSPISSSMRYKGKIGNFLTIGINTEKDDGETLKNGFLSGFAMLKGLGRIKSIIIGDFQASFGQGLTFGSGLAFGKSPNVLGSVRFQNGIRISRSFNENQFLRGVGLQTSLIKNMELTVFYSKNNIDASVKTDSLGFASEFTSLINIGNYRNQTELSKRNQVQSTIVGANVSYSIKNLKLGTTAVRTQYDKILNIQEKDVYKAFFNKEKTLENIGVNYHYYLKNTLFYGEFSSNKNLKTLSSINGVIVSLDKNLELSLIHRNYKKEYNVSFSNAFAESSVPQNEKAVYAGMSWSPFKNYKINAYLDYYQFDWLKFQVAAPSRGKDALIELQYQKRKKYQWYLRYRHEEKERNLSESNSIMGIVFHTREILRYNIEFKVSDFVSLQNRIEMVKFSIQNGKTTNGFLIFQDFNVQVSPKIKLIGRYQYFDTEDFNSRVYAFEKDVLYTFSVPAFQNRGTRFYLMSKIKLNKFSALWLRYSITSYENAEKIGSSFDEINNNKIQNISAQLQCHF